MQTAAYQQQARACLERIIEEFYLHVLFLLHVLHFDLCFYHPPLLSYTSSHCTLHCHRRLLVLRLDLYFHRSALLGLSLDLFFDLGFWGHDLRFDPFARRW